MREFGLLVLCWGKGQEVGVEFGREAIPSKNLVKSCHIYTAFEQISLARAQLL